MTKGQFLGSNTKETVCPKCSDKREKEDSALAAACIRTFVRNNKGVWQCTKCNHKLGRDKKVYPFRPASMIMKVDPKQSGFVVPHLKIPDNLVVV